MVLVKISFLFIFCIIFLKVKMPEPNVFQMPIPKPFWFQSLSDLKISCTKKETLQNVYLCISYTIINYKDLLLPNWTARLLPHSFWQLSCIYSRGSRICSIYMSDIVKSEVANRQSEGRMRSTWRLSTASVDTCPNGSCLHCRKFYISFSIASVANWDRF